MSYNPTLCESLAVLAVTKLKGDAEAEKIINAAIQAIIENSEDHAYAERLMETVRWIAGQQDLFFAECSQAEEIVARCQAALATNPTEAGDGLDDMLASVAGVPCRFCMGRGNPDGACPECCKPKAPLEIGVDRGRFKDAWEEFQGDFYKAADLDKHWGGSYTISDEAWTRLLRKVNAVIGPAESTPEQCTSPSGDFLGFKWGTPCEMCGKPIYAPTNRYMKGALVMGSRAWHGDCIPADGVHSQGSAT